MTDSAIRARTAQLLTAPNLVAVGTLGVGVLLWAAGAFSIFTDHTRYPWWAQLGVLAAALAVQLAAQRRPGIAAAAMTVMVAADLVAGPSLPLWIAASDVAYLAVVRGSDRLRRIVGAVCVAATAVGAGIGFATGGARLGVLAGLIGAAFLLSPIGYAQTVIATRRAGDAERSAALAEAQSARTAALADERRRLSRELHDTVAGHVSAIAILAEAAREAPDPRPAVESMRANSLAALRELRAMIDLLAADDDEAVTVRWSSLQPLIAAADAVGSTVTVDGGVDGLPLPVEATLTRIVGEALANATRHAPGRPIRVAVRRRRDRVEVTVRNAVDAVDAVTQGRGTTNMSVRAESIGGHAACRVHDGEWLVEVTVPVSSRQAADSAATAGAGTGVGGDHGG